MASYNELLALIDAYINQNGVQAITGQVLNGVLRAMVDQLGRGYSIMGAADPTTDPGTPDGPETWFASVPGTYTNFDGIQIVDGELALLSYVPSTGFSKNTIYEGFQTVQATIDGNVGTPAVGVSYANGILSFDFHNMKGVTGDPAGFGAVTASVDSNIGTPSVQVQTSGPDTAKAIAFQFHNLKGETGVTSVLATVDNTSGNPQCAVSLNGQQLVLNFTGLKGAQGDTGSSVDYPFTIVNNLTTDDATQALSAAQGVVLQNEVSQLDAELDGLEDAIIVGENIPIRFDYTTGLRPSGGGTMKVVSVPEDYTYIAPVKSGAKLEISIYFASGYARFAFTQTYPVVGTVITDSNNIGYNTHSIVVTAPYDGYFILSTQVEADSISGTITAIGTIGRNVFDLDSKMDEIYPAVKSLKELSVVCDTSREVDNIGGTLTNDIIYTVTKNGKIKVHFDFDDDLTWNTNYNYDLFGIKQLRGASIIAETNYRNTASSPYLQIVRSGDVDFTVQAEDNIAFANRLSGKIFFKVYDEDETPYDSINGIKETMSVYDETELDGFEEHDYIPGAGTTWYLNGKHIAIPAKYGDEFRIKANESIPVDYAWMTSEYTPPSSLGGDLPLVPGTKRTSVSANTTATIVAPVGTAYLIVNTVNGGGTQTFPRVFGVGQGKVAFENVADNTVGLYGDIYGYVGERIALSPKFGVEKVGAVTTKLNGTLYPQGMDIYGGYMFRVYDTGYCEIYDISSGVPSLVQTFALACVSETPHCNAVQFAKTIEDGDFPYLYVSACKTNSRKCFVVSVGLDGDSDLIQTITIDTITELPSDIALNAIVGDDGYLWVSGYKGTTLYFAKFVLPLTSAGDVTLGTNELVDSWQENGYDWNNYVNQGMAIYNGKLYYVYGGQFGNRGVWVYDTATGARVSDVPMTQISTIEFEDISIYNGKMYLEIVAEYFLVLTF